MMRSPIYIILILFSSASTSIAQSKDWRKDADAYIKSMEVEGYEDSDLRDRFLNSLRQEFDNGKLSDDLTALLAILIADKQPGDADKYCQAAIKLCLVPSKSDPLRGYLKKVCNHIDFSRSTLDWIRSQGMHQLPAFHFYFY